MQPTENGGNVETLKPSKVDFPADSRIGAPSQAGFGPPLRYRPRQQVRVSRLMSCLDGEWNFARSRFAVSGLPLSMKTAAGAMPHRRRIGHAGPPAGSL
jgi:hypothetical protein